MKAVLIALTLSGLLSTGCKKSQSGAPDQQNAGAPAAPPGPPPQYQAPPAPAAKDISKATPDFTLTAEDFFKQFKENAMRAAEKFNGKVIEVMGEISDVGRDVVSKKPTLTLKTGDQIFGVVCVMAEPNPWNKAVPGQKVKIKGRSEEFASRLDSCVFVETGKYQGISLTASELGKEYEANPKATTEKYDGKHLILSGEVDKKEVNEAGAAKFTLKTTGKVKVNVSFTGFEEEASKAIKPGQKIKVIGKYSFNFAPEEVSLFFCIPFDSK